MYLDQFREIRRIRTNTERRCRYRLGLHGMKLRAVPGNHEPLYYIFEDDEDNSVPADDCRFFTLDQIGEYCDELAEKDAEDREYRRSWA